jgi:hypothetical protein
MYSDTSHNKLGLFLGHKDIDITKFNVIKSTPKDFISVSSVPPVSIFIEVGILGASHYVKFKHNQDVFCEVFSCAPIVEQGRYYSIKNLLKQKETIYENIFENDLYTFNADVVFLDENKEKYNSFLIPESQKLVLSHVFPGPATSVYKAYTVIKLSGLTIETMHVYPEENIVVFTKSNISTL